MAEEREARVEAYPAAVFDEMRRAALFLNHPYRRPGIGWPEEIAALDLAAARAFYARHYQPGAATVVVVGDVAPEEAAAAVRARFAGLPGREPAPRVRPPEPAHRAARWVAGRTRG